MVLGLDDLIASKALLGRDKDKLVEAELLAIRDRLAAETPTEAVTLDDRTEDR